MITEKELEAIRSRAECRVKHASYASDRAIAYETLRLLNEITNLATACEYCPHCETIL